MYTNHFSPHLKGVYRCVCDTIAVLPNANSGNEFGLGYGLRVNVGTDTLNFDGKLKVQPSSTTDSLECSYCSKRVLLQSNVIKH